MYIIYGATETIEGDSQHAYNSAFACTPGRHCVHLPEDYPGGGKLVYSRHHAGTD